MCSRTTSLADGCSSRGRRTGSRKSPPRCRSSSRPRAARSTSRTRRSRAARQSPGACTVRATPLIKETTRRWIRQGLHHLFSPTGMWREGPPARPRLHPADKCPLLPLELLLEQRHARDLVHVAVLDRASAAHDPRDVGDWYAVGVRVPSRQRDCYSAAPPSTLSRCFNRGAERERQHNGTGTWRSSLLGRRARRRCRTTEREGHRTPQ